MSGKTCDTCGRKKGTLGCSGCFVGGKYWIPRKENKEIQSIEFKRLNGLTPTVESCTMKLIEELGELLQLIGKGQGASGETKLSKAMNYTDMIGEALDVAQAAVTMAYTIADLNEWVLENFKINHDMKLRDKGYLVEVEP